MATAPSASFNPRFLVVSLGNQGQYYETLHSAGHLALNGLQEQLHASQPRFTPERHGKKSALSSMGHKYMMLQSPTAMNTTGPWLAKAWKQVLADTNLSPADLSLVLVHDDLEEDLGVVKIRKWDRSHRGHNGIKSANASLQAASYPGFRGARISVGIGRPVERDAETVSNYVLRPISKHHKSVVQDQGASGVLHALQQLERQWEQERVKA